MHALVAVLLVLSALAEMFGTMTVWRTYQRGLRLGAAIHDQLVNEAAAAKENPIQEVLQYTVAGEVNVDALRTHLKDVRETVTGYLSKDKLTVVGLVSFIVGAVLGLASGMIALYA